jgi:hypothetical protein
MRRSERRPSRFVQAADLKPQGVTVVMDRVSMEEVGTGKDAKEKPVLTFKNASKGLVLNAVNDDTISKLFGDEDRDWTGHRICLYPTTTTFGGKTVDCVRIRAVDAADPNTFKVTKTGTAPAPKPDEPSSGEGGDPGAEPDAERDWDDEIPF